MADKAFHSARTPHERSHGGAHGSAYEIVQTSGQFSHVLFSHVLRFAQTKF